MDSDRRNGRRTSRRSSPRPGGISFTYPIGVTNSHVNGSSNHTDSSSHNSNSTSSDTYSVSFSIALRHGRYVLEPGAYYHR
jgi:hypothetical protein